MSNPGQVFWDPAINPPLEILCRGCRKPLTRYGDNWADGDGILVCIKVQLEDTGQGKVPDYVFHEPMPTGLRGAPAAR